MNLNYYIYVSFFFQTFFSFNFSLKSINSSWISPNLYFVGFSKCGTTSMARLLVEHPLLVDVGDESYHPGSESHIIDHRTDYNVINNIQTERILGRLKSKKYSNQILKEGVIMHYTPNYAGQKTIEDRISKSLKYNGKLIKNTKFFFMIRNPASRSASSWWYKNQCYKKPNHACPSFQKQMENGIQAINKIENCYKKYNISINQLIHGITSGNKQLSKEEDKVLDLCPITLMVPPNMSLYSAHIGKSIYIYQLFHWFNRIPPSQIYVMILENFVKNPVHEMEMFFNWLGIETYGEMGFKSPEHLKNLSRIQYNVHPIPESVQTAEVNPMKDRLHDFFLPYNKYLQEFFYLISQKNNKDNNNPKNNQIDNNNFTGEWNDLVQEMVGYHLKNDEQLQLRKNKSSNDNDKISTNSMKYRRLTSFRINSILSNSSSLDINIFTLLFQSISNLFDSLQQNISSLWKIVWKI